MLNKKKVPVPKGMAEFAFHTLLGKVFIVVKFRIRSEQLHVITFCNIYTANISPGFEMCFSLPHSDQSLC